MPHSGSGNLFDILPTGTVRLVLSASKRFGGKKDDTDPNFRMMMNSAAGASLSGMIISGGMNNHVLEGVLQMANGHFLRGIMTMIKG